MRKGTVGEGKTHGSLADWERARPVRAPVLQGSGAIAEEGA